MNNCGWILFSFSFWLGGYWYIIHKKDRDIIPALFDRNTEIQHSYLTFVLMIIFFITYPIFTYYNRIPTGTESCSKDFANILWDIVRAGNCILICCWNGGLLMHLKLCNWIQYRLNLWNNKIVNVNEIFAPNEFENELETIRKIIHRLGKYLVILNFSCLLYLALDIIIVINLFENDHCDLKFYCSWSEIYFSLYKIVFLVVANWVAAKVTKKNKNFY